jgi:hypothetical protein
MALCVVGSRPLAPRLAHPSTHPPTPPPPTNASVAAVPAVRARAQDLRLSPPAAWRLPSLLAPADGAAGLPALASLRLETTWCQRPLVERLLATPRLMARLRVLELRAGALPPLPAAPAGGGAPMALEELALLPRPGGLPPGGAAALAAWRAPRLRRLALRGSGAPGGELGTILAGPWAAGLEHLDVSGHPDAAPLAAAPLAALTSLRVDAACLDGGAWPAVIAAPWFRRLRRLELHDHRPGAAPGAGAAAALRALARARGAAAPRLAALSLASAGLAPGDLPGALAGAPWLGGLRELRVADDTGLGAAGLAGLAALPLPRLERLALASVGLCPAGLAALAAAPWLGGLARLELRERLGAERAGACLRLLRSEGGGGGDGGGGAGVLAALARAGAVAADFSVPPRH